MTTKQLKIDLFNLLTTKQLKIDLFNLLELINENQNLDIEVYQGKFNDISSIELLHTDNCDSIDIDINSLTDDDILDFGIVDIDSYLSTLLANSCITRDDIDEDPVIVVLVKRKI